MIDTKYGILFTIELLHKYFANGICDDFTVTPSLLTQRFLNGSKMIARQYDNKLYTGLPVDAAGKPINAPAQNMQLTFFMQLNSPLFFNYTNLPFAYASGKIYYFTNRNNNTANSKHFLSQLLFYDNAKTYSPGDIVTDGAGMVFQSIKSGSGITPSLANSSSWIQVDVNQYMSELDALQWLPSVSTYSFASLQTSVSLDVWGYNAGAGDYSTNVLSKATALGRPSGSFTLDLSSLLPGKYKLRVNSDEKWIYINDELNGVRTFGVIDIYNDSSLATAYQFLAGSGTLASPAYSIYFLNRYTIWKYILASGSAGSIVDNAGVYHFTTPAASTIFSLTPMPLSEKALNLKLSINTNDFSPVSCASPQRVVEYKPAADTYSCSEIFLNY